MNKTLSILLVAAMALAMAACGNSKNSSSSRSGENIMRHSKLLSIEDHREYKTAKIFNAHDSATVDAVYILIDKDAKMPNGLPQGTVIRTPIDNAVVFSSVFAGILDELGEIGIVKGVVDAGYFKHPVITDGLKSGKVADLGPASGPSLEKIAAQQPQAIFLSIYDGMDVKNIDKSGVPIIRMSDNFETDPLARAEWMKLFGVLTGKEDKADSIFDNVEKEYSMLKEQAKKYTSKPSVLVENMYQGVWYLPGGASYQARIIEDAGGRYLWGDDKSAGSLNLSFEEVLAKAHDADIWLLKLFGTGLDKKTLLGMDRRYGGFKAVDKGGVYYSDTQKTRLFEEFPYHPERLLRDYMLVFHPEAEGKIRYFKKMGEKF